MTYEEKLDIVIKAIVEARKLARKGQDTKLYTKLYLTSDNGLKGFNLNELYDILLQLEQKEKVFFVQDIPSDIKKLFETDFEKKDYFLLEIKDAFDSWHEKLLIKNKSRLENLSGTNLTNITHIMQLIEEQLQLDQSEKLTIGFISSAHEIEGYEPEDINDIINTYVRSLTYLKNVGVVKDFTTAYMTLSSDLTLNIARFFEVLGQINSLEQNEKEKQKENKKRDESTNKEEVTKSQAKTDVVYEITYTKQRQILMNNAQIGKPDFNSENDLVFGYLYKHPNESFTKEQIEKAVGVKLNKSLHKIVENLGFEGDTKEVFISVSKNAIQFRNPITKKDLEEMKKPAIKLIKGGGKLILPH